jgi:hypothetical protein
MSTSRRIPVLAGREGPANLAVLMREAFVAINDLVIARLADRGHGDVRPAHAAVFQYLDDTGTYGERARGPRADDQTGHGRARPPPGGARLPGACPRPDRQTGQARPAHDRGRDVIAVAQALVPEVEDVVTDLLGADRVLALRTDLDTIRRAFTASEPASAPGLA